MSNTTNWMNRQQRLGWILLIAGILIGLIGLALPSLFGDLGFNTRIVTAIGILLLGIGISYLVRYRSYRADPQAAKRVLSSERDERMQMIRARAGSRAFWVSIALTYVLLMWESFADNGSLPALSDDLLWFALAAAFIIPMIVYIAGVAIENSRG